jgi:hypothetical protein
VYEAFCPECEKVYDEWMVTKGICDYCYSIKGLDHVFERYEGNIFGEVAGAGNSNIKFTGWWDK